MKSISRRLNKFLDDYFNYLVMAGAAFLYLYFSGEAKKKKELEFLNNLANPSSKDGLAASAAVQLQMAFNPSGIGWLRSMDGTKVDRVLATVQAMKKQGVSMAAVANLYNQRYNRDLLADMEAELSTAEWEMVFGVSESVVELR